MSSESGSASNDAALEREVARLLEAGYNPKQIARKLRVSLELVESFLPKKRVELSTNKGFQKIIDRRARLKYLDSYGKENKLSPEKSPHSIRIVLKDDSASQQNFGNYFLKISREEGLNGGVGEPSRSQTHQNYPDKSENNIQQIIDYLRSIESSKDRGSIEQEDNSSELILELASELSMLDHDDDRRVNLLRGLLGLFPELRIADAHALGSALPENAPALWNEHREAGDTPPTFIKRHYEPWLGKGLTRADIRRLDQKLYQALASWVQRHGDPGLDLPTIKEINDRWVERVERGAPAPSDPSQAAKLKLAMRYRARKADPKSSQK